MERVIEALSSCGVSLLTAPPGAGKSTVLPLRLLGRYGRIVMLEPRRLAARAVAERLAESLGEAVGATVGYTVRFERRVSSATRIEVVTEGVLTRRLLGDSLLEGVDLVVFDEFHERSLEADVALALCRQLREMLRPELHILIMSATIDTRSLSAALGGAPVVAVEGSRYPLEETFSSDDCEVETCSALAARAIREELPSAAGDVLAFLPGQGEIHRCRGLLGELPGVEVCELYGAMGLGEQRRALRRSEGGRRKVVLATNLAETSLTVPGVRVVVDTGLCRVSLFDGASQMDRLRTVRVSADMATQRAGRASREGPGRCRRLYTLATAHRMAATRQPQIVTSDLTELALELSLWGSPAEALPWVTAPPSGALARGREVLVALGALDEAGRATDVGRRMARLPCHPRLARMLLTGAAEAADVAALVEEKDPIAGEPGVGCDIEERLERLRRQRQRGSVGGAWQRVERVAQSLRSSGKPAGTGRHGDDLSVGALLALAYPERIGSLAQNGTYELAGGGSARLERDDALNGSPWVVCASCGGVGERPGRVFLGARLRPEELQPFVRRREVTTFDVRAGRLVAQEEVRLGRLTLGRRPLPAPSRGRAVLAVVEAVRDYGERLLTFDEAYANTARRVSTLRAWRPELGLPAVDAAALLASCDEWLPGLLGRELTAQALAKIDLSGVALSRLTWAQREALDRLAPAALTAPTGSSIRLAYGGPGEPPVMSVRLQEMFGQTDTPLVDEGRHAVTVELLSPGYKPVQRTSDLRSFWRVAYRSVRAEMMRRYPRHSWPEEGAIAEPVRGPRRRR